MATVAAPAERGARARTLGIRRKNRLRQDELSVVGTLFLVLFAIVMFVPFVLLFGHAFETYSELYHFPPIIIPYQLTLQNFSTLVLSLSSFQVPFARYLFNSAMVATAVVLGTVVIATVAAYPLSKHQKMPGHGIIWFLVIASLMYAGPAINVPQYLVMERLGLINTDWSLILPPVFGTSFGLFLMKQFIDSLPDAVLEAARIDGASEWRILKEIVYPATRPAWAVLILLTFVQVWNDAVSPQLFIYNDALKTLPVAFANLVPAGNTIAFAGAQAVAAMLMALPPMILFLIMQSRIIATMQFAGMGGS